jgi:hypothetical protein
MTIPPARLPRLNWGLYSLTQSVLPSTPECKLLQNTTKGVYDVRSPDVCSDVCTPLKRRANYSTAEYSVPKVNKAVTTSTPACLLLDDVKN